MALAFAGMALGVATASPASADSLKSVNQYVAETQARIVGNGQCAIMVEDYLRKVYGVSVNLAHVPNLGAYGFAPAYDGGRQMQAAGFSWSTSKSDLQNGDVVVWAGGGGGLGHVALWFQGKVYDSNSGWPGRTTTSGQAVGQPLAAALETGSTTAMLNNGDGLRYQGRWRKTPPVNGSAGQAPNPPGSSTPPHTYPTLSAANVRAAATTTSALVKQVGAGTQLTIDCYVNGQVVGGTGIWNHVPSLNGYISDSLLLTGSNSAVVPLCSSTPTSGQHTWANAKVYRLSTNFQASSYGTLIATLAKDTTIDIDCWVVGQGVPATTHTGTAYTDYVWYHLKSYPGWISDASVQTSQDNATVGQYGGACALGTLQGPFPVIGSAVVHDGASSGSAPVTTLTSSSRVSIDCTTAGDAVTNTGTGQTSTLWDHVSGLGYIPDVFVLTGVNSAAAPACAVSSVVPDATPVAGTAPTVSGSAKVGGVLTAKTGTWSTVGTSLSYSWSLEGADGVLGTGPTLKVPPAAAGQRVVLTVSGSAATYATTSLGSTPTKTVAGHPLVLPRKGKLSRKHGTATLKVKVTGAGELTLKALGESKKLVKKVSVSVASGGKVKLVIKPTKRGRQLLERKHRLSVDVKVSFRPYGGSVVAKRHAYVLELQ